ncbi:sensor histidine kinase [Clostridium sp. E02]|uniref:sensor histidine kinase n=1 Tax=Clostridium sp. E02 TaxID=2487134 RepID=UPI0013DE4232|nr:sensor histidine kinase [Clostridium sp. E02]
MTLEKIYINFFTKQNVRRQLITIFIFAILIPVSIIGGMVYYFSRRQMLQNYKYLSESDGIRVRSIILTTTLPLYEIYESLSSDTDLNKLMTAHYPSDQEAMKACSRYPRFKQILASNASISSIRLYTQSNLLHSYSDNRFFFPIDKTVRTQDWYQKASVTSGNFFQSTLRKNQVGSSYWELAYYCHIPMPRTGSYAILVLTLSNDHLRNLIKDNSSHIYISVNQDPVFYSTIRHQEGEDFPVDIDHQKPNYNHTDLFELEGSTHLSSLLSLKPYRTDDKIYILSVNPNAMSNIRHMEFSFLLIMLFALFLPGLLFVFFTGYFSARIRTLRLAMHKVSNNDYEIIDSVLGDDELSATFSDLKNMVRKIKKAQGDIYAAQMKEQTFYNQQQQMEYKLLINQINPHFLYNTLETIRMKAFTDGNQEVATAIKLLGKSLRYVLNNTKTTLVTLNQEIDYIKNYLAIQKFRFGERLNYTIDMDASIDPKCYRILPLLMQPIIENSISHGIEPTGKKGYLLIKIRKYQSNGLKVSIYDNGAGMSKTTIFEVMTKLKTPPKNREQGIGLYNINNRIKLFYGQEYGLVIQSKQNFGTLVTIKIPVDFSMEDSL